MYLLTLQAAKCSHSTTHSTIAANGRPFLLIPPDLDPQSLVQMDGLIGVLHHQNHKGSRAPVEFYRTGQSMPCCGLPDEENIHYPSAVAAQGDRLAVAANGREFKGSIRLYRRSGEASFRLEQTINLKDHQARPIGIAFDGDDLLFASYSGQTLWRLTATGVSLVLDVTKFGQTTPIWALPRPTDIAVLGHVDGSLAIYDRKYGLPSRIIRNGLCYPWSVTSTDEGLLVANRGDETSRGCLVGFDAAGRQTGESELDGVVVVRSCPDQ